MNSDSQAERRERDRRSQLLQSVHDLRENVARSVVAAEQGFTASGTAKLPDIDVTEQTVKGYFDTIENRFGVEALFAKTKDDREGPLGPSETLAQNMPYNPDEMEQAAEQREEETFDARITEIEETTAGDVYDGEAEEPDREVIQCTVVASTDTEDMEFTDTFSMPKGPQSWHNPNFKLGKFQDHYGELPREDTQVEAEYNDDGFLRVKVGE
jgi:hypothetical protein